MAQVIIKKDIGGTFDDFLATYNALPYESEDLPEIILPSSDADMFSNQEIINLPATKIEEEEEEKEEEPKVVPKKVVTQVINKQPEEQFSNEELDTYSREYGHMQGFVDLLKQEHIPVTITSGVRNGAVTSKGVPSWHSKGWAIDIVPNKGISWGTLKNIFANNPKILKYMRDVGIGILDETSSRMLAKTGGTGPHWHIGKDTIALNTFNKWFPQVSVWK